MHLDEPVGTKFKRVCTYFPNLALLTKSATPGDIQVTFGNASVGNKYLWETVTSFSLTGSLESPTVVSIDSKRAFTSAGKKIRLPVTEVLLRAAGDNLACLKNLRDLALSNTLLLPPFITKVVILDGKTSATEFLKIFATKIAEPFSEAASETLESKEKDKDESGKDKENNKKKYGKSAASQ